jgi:putative nucleotidyltransferase with HDIG domain
MLQKSNAGQAAQQKAASSVDGFAPLPGVAMKILEMVADPETTSGDLEMVIRGDISLVASVLKLANSAFYGVRRQVDSLRHALLLIGKSEIQSLVLSKVMFQAFKVPAGFEKELMVGVWRHSLECGLASESIGKQIGEENPVFFLGGMLHDIGKLVVIKNFIQDIEELKHYGELSEEQGLVMEHDTLGYGHDELGAMLLHRWMFPDEIEEILREHHNYAGIAGCRKSCQVMILANLLCRYVTAMDLLEAKQGTETSVIALRGILLRCGAASGIIPGDGTLVQLEYAYRAHLKAKNDLLEILMM